MNILLELFAIARVSSPQQVAYGGEVLGESVIESEEQIGSEVIHTYDVSVVCFMSHTICAVLHILCLLNVLIAALTTAWPSSASCSTSLPCLFCTLLPVFVHFPLDDCAADFRVLFFMSLDFLSGFWHHRYYTFPHKSYQWGKDDARWWPWSSLCPLQCFGWMIGNRPALVNPRRCCLSRWRQTIKGATRQLIFTGKMAIKWCVCMCVL